MPLSALAEGLALAVVGAVVGAAAGAWYANRSASHAAAQELLRRFLDPQFYQARSAVWAIRTEWMAGSRDVVRHYLLPGHGKGPDEPQEAMTANGLKRHQNLSLFLYFLATIAYLYNEKAADRRFLDKAFAHLYCWYRPFLPEFVAEYLRQRDAVGDRSPLPIWVDGVRTLEAAFGPAAGRA